MNERAMPAPRDCGFPRQMLRFSHDVSVVAVAKEIRPRRGGAPQGVRQVMPGTAEIIAQTLPVRLVDSRGPHSRGGHQEGSHTPIADAAMAGKRPEMPVFQAGPPSDSGPHGALVDFTSPVLQ